MGEFWDHHDLGRFWDLTRPADVTVDLDETLEDNDLWDGQIEEDAEAGRLDPLADKAIDAHRRGESRKL